MNTQDLGARGAELSSTILYANVATSHDDRPWNTPVTAIADTNLDLYWSSWTEAIHSRNIRANPTVFVTYYDSMRERARTTTVVFTCGVTRPSWPTAVKPGARMS
ncbi:pyridoxamine 5'-phosphate oxidase family protein [Salinisphaera hydrothermalis]|uniref:pyridoxamine 5'-phosphate oxidase family protein n=1 Tax=Salinisphaera hydrothermalis TaxID=563188 RepID=UPI00333F897B